MLEARRAGKTRREILLACEQALLDRDVDASVSDSALKRYLSQLGEMVVPAAHQPQVASENARLMVPLIERLNMLDQMLNKWIGDAANSGVEKYGIWWDVAQQRAVGGVDEALEPVPIFVADWQARTGMSRELREFLKVIADLLESIYSAQAVADFQQVALEAIEEADPATAAKVVQAFNAKRSLRAAALLGVQQ